MAVVCDASVVDGREGNAREGGLIGAAEGRGKVGTEGGGAGRG